MKEPKFDESLLTVYPVEIRVGLGLVPMVQSDQFKASLNQVRRDLALGFGFLTPPIRVRDNQHLHPDAYDIKVKEWWIAQVQIDPSRLLALDVNGASPLQGVGTTDPVFGLPSLWIRPELRAEAENLGSRVWEPGEVLASHLTEILMNFAPEFLGRDEVQAMIERLAKKRPTLAGELREAFSLGTIRQVLQALLDERVPIRDLATIGETLCDLATGDWDLDSLVNAARRALRRTISGQYVNNEECIEVVDLSPDLVQRLSSHLNHNRFHLPREVQEQLIARISKAMIGKHSRSGESILFTPETMRAPLRRLTRERHPEWVFLCAGDIAPEVRLQIVETLDLEENPQTEPAPALACSQA